jgi:mannose-6-phosphate isomerase-like protein (cupin superfamily)
MADFSVTNYADVEPVGGGLHFLRDALDCEHLGVSVIDADAGWEGKPHDHAESDHEEVYVLVEGSATVRLGDASEEVSLAVGDAVRVDPGTRRQFVAGDDGAVLVVVGAP